LKKQLISAAPAPRIIFAALSAAGLLAIADPAAAADSVVISQVFGGYGNSYNADYIELFNSGSLPVTMSNGSIQHSRATGTGL